MTIKSRFSQFYDLHYKPLLIITLVLLLGSLAVLGVNYARTGEFVKKGVSLKGGMSLTIAVDNDIDTSLLEKELQQAHPQSDIVVRRISVGGELRSIIIEATGLTEADLLHFLEARSISTDRLTSEEVGSTLGASFFRQTRLAILWAFIAMSLVVLITFRSFVPSLFVILAATADLIETLAVISLFDMRLSTAGVAAFLMLIGYSVDTDILLTTRVLKRKTGTIFEGVCRAARTGILMTLTAITAVLVGYFFTDSNTIKQIMLIIFIGLLFDNINTWIQNAGILRWYLERKDAKRGAQE